MRKIMAFVILGSLLVMLVGCLPYKVHQVSKTELLNAFQEASKDGYRIQVFVEDGSFPKEAQPLLNFNKYEEWTGIQIYRSIDRDHRVNYLDAFSEDQYPFYIVTSKKGIELQTNSADDVEVFFENLE